MVGMAVGGLWGLGLGLGAPALLGSWGALGSSAGDVVEVEAFIDDIDVALGSFEEQLVGQVGESPEVAEGLLGEGLDETVCEEARIPRFLQKSAQGPGRIGDALGLDHQACRVPR